MTPAEVKAWLGFPADLPRTLRPEIVAGMAGVPCPPAGPADEHITVFSVFLACAGPVSEDGWPRIFEPEGSPGASGPAS